MKTPISILLLAMVITFASCKNDEPTNARDKYIGTWSGYNTLNMPDLGIVNQVTAVTFTFQPGAADDKLKITNTANGKIYTATVTGNTYTYDAYTYTDNSAGFPIIWHQNGYGTLSGSTISEFGDVLYTFDTAEYTATWSQTLNKQ